MALIVAKSYQTKSTQSRTGYKLRSIWLLGALLWILSVTATPSWGGADTQECGGSLNTEDRAACETARYEALRTQVDKRFAAILVRPYHSLLHPRLEIAEDIWRAYVESQCDLEADLMFGSAAAFVAPQCKIRAYKKRLLFLDEVAKALEQQH